MHRGFIEPTSMPGDGRLPDPDLTAVHAAGMGGMK